MTSDRSTLTTVAGRQLTVTNRDKVLYPDSGFTKGQVIDYYMQVAEVMLPHVRDRPLTMKRYPDGVAGESFFEKHLPDHAPDWVRHVAVPSEAGSIEYAVVCDLPTLVWAANLATIEFHVPLWHVGRRRTLPGPPDHMVFDLDPGEGASIVECCRVARSIVEVLDEGRAGCRPKTSGSKGLQLYVPMPGRPTWEKARDRAHRIAVQLEQDQPDLVVSTPRKSERTGKVFIDWSQNHPAKTTVAAYSLRGRSEPTASTPLAWDEVDQCAREGDPASLRFTADDVLDRIDEHGDLFATV